MKNALVWALIPLALLLGGGIWKGGFLFNAAGGTGSGVLSSTTPVELASVSMNARSGRAFLALAGDVSSGLGTTLTLSLRVDGNPSDAPSYQIILTAGERVNASFSGLSSTFSPGVHTFAVYGNVSANNAFYTFNKLSVFDMGGG